MTKVLFDCSFGQFTVEVDETWAPLGAERFLGLVRDGFFSEVRFFRVVTKPRPFIVQFGISGDAHTAAKWKSNTIKDDKVTQSNKRGTLTFATSGPNSRTTQLFVNLADNAFLDNQGFSPIGVVTEGLESVDKINDQYGEAPDQGRIQREGNTYLEQRFPELDYIKSATIVE